MILLKGNDQLEEVRKKNIVSNFWVFSSVSSRTQGILASSEERIEKFDDLTPKEKIEKSRFFMCFLSVCK